VGESKLTSKGGQEVGSVGVGVSERGFKKERAVGGGDVTLRSLEEILLSAGVEVTDELRNELPPKEDIISMYGSKPNIIGLDRCETFQSTVVKGDGFIAPAGMFNTGTNLLQSLLTQNCYLPDKMEKYGKENTGMRWQVPWGKHSPVSWRLRHSAPSMTTVNQTAVLPALVIKDPYTWMDSMCRHSYAANWKHFEGHCPNLVPITSEESDFLKKHEKGTFNVNVRYRDTNITHHDSLADLYNTWYGDWIDADFPRLIVRFEDLLFHAEYVVEKICQCGGGVLHNDKPFKYSVDSAKKGKAHKGANGLVKSITKYSDKNKRLKSFSREDLAYAVNTISSDIMNTFGYTLPQI